MTRIGAFLRGIFAGPEKIDIVIEKAIAPKPSPPRELKPSTRHEKITEYLGATVWKVESGDSAFRRGRFSILIRQSDGKTVQLYYVDNAPVVVGMKCDIKITELTFSSECWDHEVNKFYEQHSSSCIMEATVLPGCEPAHPSVFLLEKISTLIADAVAEYKLSTQGDAKS